jgi:hypothetical protein
MIRRQTSTRGCTDVAVRRWESDTFFNALRRRILAVLQCRRRSLGHSCRDRGTSWGPVGYCRQRPGWALLWGAYDAGSLAARYPWLGQVNPVRESGVAQQNCVLAAIAFVLSEREGRSFEAPLSEALPNLDLVNFHR